MNTVKATIVIPAIDTGEHVLHEHEQGRCRARRLPTQLLVRPIDEVETGVGPLDEGAGTQAFEQVRRGGNQVASLVNQHRNHGRDQQAQQRQPGQHHGQNGQNTIDPPSDQPGHDRVERQRHAAGHQDPPADLPRAVDDEQHRGDRQQVEGDRPDGDGRYLRSAPGDSFETWIRGTSGHVHHVRVEVRGVPRIQQPHAIHQKVVFVVGPGAG